MSADNFLGILKCKDGKYRGYMCFASCEYGEIATECIISFDELEEHEPVFVADSLNGAISRAALETNIDYYEYGYDTLNVDTGGI